jgi:hypothetical protein
MSHFDVFNGAPTILLHPGAPKKADAAHVVIIDFSLKSGVSGSLLPLFMGTEPGEAFRQSLGEKGKGMFLFALDGFDTLLSLLMDLQNRGVTHVNFNAVRDDPNPIPIAEVIVSLRNRPRL